MRVERLSPFTGKVNFMDLPITQAQLDKWKSGMLIQNVMPFLTVEEREFLMTGLTPKDWAAIFPEEA